MFKEFIARDSTKKLIYFSVLVLLLYSLRSIFDLVLLTFLFSYFIDNVKEFIVVKLNKFIKISPQLITFIIYILITLLLVFVSVKYIPIAINQSITLVEHVSNIQIENSKYIAQILEQIDIEKYIQMSVNNIVTLATHFGKGIFNLFLALILSLFFVLQKDQIKCFMKKFSKSKISPFYEYLSYFGKSFLNSFGKVIQAQIIIALVNTFISLIGLYFIGFKSLIALGFMIFILSLIPVAGVIISLVPLCLMAFEMGGIVKVIYVLVMIAIIHSFESYVLNPKLMSNKTNLPVFFTFVILIISEHFMGAWGLLLGIPIVIFILDMFGVDLSNNSKSVGYLHKKMN
ncbi:pheromone autoinducer 2 transporter [Clostridium acetireducens DSM 10703]|uniref:Pheromone autoinducer 2 transporter n=1 Tax=Clostridium acetireducens DSM 10703 TaxID=1121290 RepID=A0A1E8EZ24_9CLOT|nr:AI-2E family transporter [Clostridium acetireducens]OFI05936.1 pheromone autoinducer 2 transporter [Clostridium acetireducens DSM 10703]